MTNPDALNAFRAFQSWRDKAEAEASKSSPSSTKVQAWAACATLRVIEYQLRVAGDAADATALPSEPSEAP